jgi:hypothetical protein
MGANMNLKLITGSLLAAASLLAVTPASANVLNLTGLNDPIAGTQNEIYLEGTVRATLNCEVSCEGDTSTAANNTIHDAQTPFPDVSTVLAPSSVTVAELFELEQGASLADELEAINDILNTNFTLADLTKDESGDTTFTTDAQYFLIKIGQDPNYALIENTGGEQDFIYTAIGGLGAGLSHITFVNGDTVVSEPGVLALFGVGVLLMGFMRRRAIA